MSEADFRHWRWRTDSRGVVWLTLDREGESTNALSAAVMAELDRIVVGFERQAPQALVIDSAKDAGFIAGADIGEFSALDTLEGAQALLARGWHLFNRVAALPFPTAALIRGHCLGGGLELALACRYRIAVDEPSTRLGLPEVMLGIFPGWGGMRRLPRLVGPQLALDMMLTGKTLDARRAKRSGLADLVVPPRVMVRSTVEYVLSGKAPRRLSLLPRLLNGPLKRVVAKAARKQVAAKARPEHYPAPYAIVDCWENHDGDALAVPDYLDAIVSSSTAQNLVRVFHLQERLKGFGKAADFPVKRVHIIGAGVMGGDIAAWCALRGLTVTLQDQSIERIAPAVKRAATLFSRRLRDRLAERNALDRLIPDPRGDGVGLADVVIEAIFENLEAKHALLRSIEPRLKPGAVLASNTSSLRLEDLRTVLAQPERLVGIHFFNPVAKMPLVEVVEAEGGDEVAHRKACAFVRTIDKLPLPVKSAPGFLVNAVLAPYMLEAMRAVDEGIAPENIDASMLAFGMPMGPIELADSVGLDIALAAGRELAGGDAPACLLAHVEAGDLGKKTGRGFYPWVDGKAQKGEARTEPGLSERFVQPLLERTRALVAERVVADPDLADAGVIFGTGFAPFTGGPLHYLRSRNG
jgi:3-hydroxyacyl-CoA dehydrogenase/enoyl-CoA hydratase/3-hydroxybutyryl-CoA epimerase